MQCGESIRLGTLREIRALPSEFEEAASHSQNAFTSGKNNWSPRRRAVFAAGILLLVAGGLVGGYAWKRASSIDTTRPETAIPSEKLAEIDRMTYQQIWETWENLDVSKLTDYIEPEFQKNKREATLMGIVRFVGFGLAGIGVAGLVWALLPNTGSNTRAGKRRAPLDQHSSTP